MATSDSGNDDAMLGCLMILGAIAAVTGVVYVLLGWAGIAGLVAIVVVVFIVIGASGKKGPTFGGAPGATAGAASVTVKLPHLDSESYQLLKDATALKKAGDLEAAISKLREAYAAIERDGEQHNVDPFLRLPAYLQAAGRSDEAWREYNNLIVHGFPNQGNDWSLLTMFHSKIYDKMRLFLQREGKAEQAIVFGVQSLVSWQLGLHLQDRKEELAERADVVKKIEPLLKKAKRDDSLKRVVDVVCQELNELPAVDWARLRKCVAAALA